MEINDEMVDAAFEEFASKTIWNRNAMRAALEAALGERPKCDSDLLKHLEAEIARLREALEPFAKWAPVLDGMPDHGSIIATYEINQSEYPNISSVRCARAALETKG